MEKIAGRCIFCGEGKLSKEHIWANWLREYIPRPLEKHKVRSALIMPDDIKEKVQVRSGDPHSRRIRCVCRGCNNGWMSQLQELAKPVLIPLIKGQATIINRKNARLLAGWASMFVMVAEFMNSEMVAVPAQDRAWLRLHKTPPSHWRIWVGSHECTQISKWNHNVVTLAHGEDEKGAQSYPPVPNTQTSTFLVGDQLLFHVMSSVVGRRLVSRWRHPKGIEAKLPLVWPFKGRAFHWPPAGTLSDTEAYEVAEAFFERVQRQIQIEERDVTGIGLAQLR